MPRLASAQSRLLRRLAKHPRTTRRALVNRALPRSIPDTEKAQWETELNLQLDLLALRGWVTLSGPSGEQLCEASDRIRTWRPAQRRTATSKRRIIPLSVAVFMAATSGCSVMDPVRTPSPEAAPTAAAGTVATVAAYNPDGTRPPEQMEQFYNPKTGNMVYRFCIGSECPQPTPKKPAVQLSRVQDITADQGLPPAASVTPSAPAANAGYSGQMVKDSMRIILPTATPNPGKDAATKAKAVNQLNALRNSIVNPKQHANQAASDTVDAALAKERTATPRRPVNMPSNSTPQGAVEDPVKPVSGNTMRIPSEPSASAPTNPNLKLASYQRPQPSDSTENKVPTGTSIEAFVASWAQLWADKQPDAYAALYAEDFKPSYGAQASREAWLQQRRSVMVRPGKVSVQTNVVSSRAVSASTHTVRFWQTYASATFKSRVLKEMVLVRDGAGWRIQREVLVPTETQSAAVIS